ncbi:DUF3800 domain-containing protein [Bacteroides heparinolyticus]
MNEKYAFVDEFGAFGYNFNNGGCSTHFIISAIIVDEVDLPYVANATEDIRKKYFQTGEMKSSKIGRNHHRRLAILKELKKLPIYIFSFVCDKQKVYENSGLRYKESFYKFLNDMVYQELRIAYKNLIITADKLGGNDYLQSFANYVQSKERPISLFDKSAFRFEDSKHQVIIQAADLISGALAYNYDLRKKEEADGYNYLSFLDSKILRVKIFPETKDSFDVNEAKLDPTYNYQIASICFRKAKHFIETHSNTEDDVVRQQIAILNYLLFRFMNRSTRTYIPTKELINQLVYLGYEKLSTQTFRSK